ncbi:hypothetical protein AB4K08_20275 [Serratia fonticola]|uniref:hypothetical protein n=1 Tax=Serratia fonticola TaxID=47917 RepID=UPI0034C5D5BF
MLPIVFNNFMGEAKSPVPNNLVLIPLLASLLLLLSPVRALVATVLLMLGFHWHFIKQDRAAITAAANETPSSWWSLLYPWYFLKRVNIIGESILIVILLTVGFSQLSSKKANTRELSKSARRTTTQIFRDNSRTAGGTAQCIMADNLMHIHGNAYQADAFLTNGILFPPQLKSTVMAFTSVLQNQEGVTYASASAENKQATYNIKEENDQKK